MNKKSLAVQLSKLISISSNNPSLEQYQTDSEIAAEILWNVFMNNDTKDKIIADLGCGNGIFGIGALILGAKLVYFVDIDRLNIETTKTNCKFKNAEYFPLDVNEFNKKVDVVIMNPPFGVQNEHADRIFLKKAMKLSNKIYSLHKVESKKFIDILAKDHMFNVENIIELDFLLKKTMKFHEKNKYLVKVGCWVLKRKV